MSSSSVNSDVEAGKGFLNSKAGSKAEKGKMDPKEDLSFFDTKFFRLLSVFLYVCLVSGIGFMFALYHFLFWDSTMPPVAKVPGHEVY